MSDEPDAVRPWLKWFLEPLVPATWEILTTLEVPQRITVPTVTIFHHTIESEPKAPRSDNLVNETVVRVADPHEDFERAEDDLDDAVLSLIYVLKGSERIRFARAEKKKVPERPYFAWEISIQVLSTNPNATPTEQD